MVNFLKNLWGAEPSEEVSQEDRAEQNRQQLVLTFTRHLEQMGCHGQARALLLDEERMRREKVDAEWRKFTEGVAQAFERHEILEGRSHGGFE